MSAIPTVDYEWWPLGVARRIAGETEFRSWFGAAWNHWDAAELEYQSWVKR